MAQSLNQFVEESRKERAYFASLAQREEARAIEDPANYRLRVRLMAFLGYAYVIGLMLFLILVLVGVVCLMIFGHTFNIGVIKLAFVTVPVIWLLFKSLWVSIPPPNGVVLRPEEAPELFRNVAEIAAKTNSANVHQIIISPDVNAAAVQVPRFGLFGPSRSYLILGLPLMLTTTGDEMRSIIAHEFGHFSGQHSKFGRKIYRLNQTWMAIAGSLGDSDAGALLIRRFLKWYFPRFHAVSLGLQRQNEYDADAVAAKLYGPKTFAAALTRVGVAEAHIAREFWEPVGDRAKAEPEPPANLLLGMVSAAKRPVDSALVRSTLASSLSAVDDFEDSHPILTDRLRAVGLKSDVDGLIADLVPVETSAAETLLGSALDSVIQRVDAELLDSVRLGWQATYNEHQEATARLEIIRAQAEDAPLPLKTLVERGILTLNLFGAEAGEESFREALASAPDNPDLTFGLGYAMLQGGKPEGIGIVEQSMASDPQFVQRGLNALAEYYQTKNDFTSLNELKERIFTAQAAEEFARQEAGALRLGDTFVSHPDPQTAPDLVAQISKRKDVERAYLVDKIIPGFANRTQTVLVVFNRHWGVHSAQPRELLCKLINETALPPGILIYVPSDFRKWRKKMDSLPGALIYDRNAR